MSACAGTYSMSKATICCFRIRSCLRRKREGSVGDDMGGLVGMRALARVRDRVVLWTIWWARSSKTEDCARISMHQARAKVKSSYVD